jgi:primosomal protein N''
MRFRLRSDARPRSVVVRTPRNLNGYCKKSEEKKSISIESMKCGKEIRNTEGRLMTVKKAIERVCMCVCVFED